ncbi:MAG: helix-turn-helix domain-containing protein [Thermoguttaceae bacterium]|jgi:excisionase family DNA binding protein|nr:helix-turn-helix domain-containing protein [Thermoguttaceae bacterium]
MSNTPTILPELLTLPQAAEYLNLGQRTLARWSSEGKAPAPLKLTPGRCGALRYRRADLAAWIAAGCPDLRDEPAGVAR